MTQINSNGHTWLFQLCPEYWSHIDVWDGRDLVFVHKSYGIPDHIELPEGEWSIHCHSTTVTEEQAAEIVTNEGTAERPCYPDYNDPLCGHKSAIQSLLSMAQAEGIPFPFLVLKKQ